MALTAELARAVLAQAKADETYEAPIPEDDATAIEEATELVDQARAAWEANIRGPEVEAILNLANSGEEDGGGSDDEPEASGDDGEDLASIEPWEGYDGEGVKDIKGALDYSKENDEADEFLELARHIWEYESANKGRSTVLDYLNKLAEGDGGEPSGEAEGSSGEGEDGPGDAEGDASGEGDGPEAEAADRAAAPDAEADAGAEAPESGGEEAADAEAAPKAGSKRGRAAGNGKLTLTREQILEALASGSVEIG